MKYILRLKVEIRPVVMSQAEGVILREDVETEFETEELLTIASETVKKFKMLAENMSEKTAEIEARRLNNLVALSLSRVISADERADLCWLLDEVARLGKELSDAKAWISYDTRAIGRIVAERDRLRAVAEAARNHNRIHHRPGSYKECYVCQALAALDREEK